MVVCKEEIEKLKKMERTERGLIMMPYYICKCVSQNSSGELGDVGDTGRFSQ